MDYNLIQAVIFRRNNNSKRFFSFKVRYLCFLCIFFLARDVFAAPPIHGGSLKGLASADARSKLISTAESFLGTPYSYAGLSKRGIDCSGLVYMSFMESLDISIPRSSDGIYKWAEKIGTNELQPGDLVFFITTGRNVSHLGIYTGNGRFIHSASDGPRTGVMYSHIEESYWKRTYHGAGRALPTDKDVAAAMATGFAIPSATPVGSAAETSYPSGGDPYVPPEVKIPAAAWAEPGIFAGFGISWNWGGFAEGSSSVFRGFSAMAMFGYKWSKFRLGMELRPGWDRALGVFRLPITVSAGNEYIQGFFGPAITLGEPSLEVSDGARDYEGGGEWRWELGLSLSFPFVKTESGAFSAYAETAWQPYQLGDGASGSFKPDFTANFRLSTGFRYLFHIR